jgi:hypothetical protein
MNPTTIKLAILATAIAAAAAGGWVVNGWRLAGELERLNGIVDTQQQSIETLAGVNKSCAAGLEDVKAAVKGYVDASDARGAAAAKAMAAAADAAKGHLAAAKDALNRPPAPPGQECATAAAEASAYARKRKGAP